MKVIGGSAAPLEMIRWRWGDAELTELKVKIIEAKKLRCETNKAKGAGHALHKSADRQQMACLRGASALILLRIETKISTQFKMSMQNPGMFGRSPSIETNIRLADVQKP